VLKSALAGVFIVILSMLMFFLFFGFVSLREFSFMGLLQSFSFYILGLLTIGLYLIPIGVISAVLIRYFQTKSTNGIFWKIIKWIFISLFVSGILFASYIYIYLSADNTTISKTSPSGKYKFIVDETCWFGCSYAGYIKENTGFFSSYTEFCYIDRRSERSLFDKYSKITWDKDEKVATIHFFGDLAYNINIQNDCHKYERYYSPSESNSIYLQKKCIKKPCRYEAQLEKDNSSTTTNCKLSNKQIEELLKINPYFLKWQNSETIISWGDEPYQTIDLNKQCPK
jgi:hypothetical protein